MGSFYFAGGAFHCQNASNSIAGDYRTAACQGSACTSSEEIDVTEAVPLSIEAGLDPSPCVRAMPRY